MKENIKKEQQKNQHKLHQTFSCSTSLLVTHSFRFSKLVRNDTHRGSNEGLKWALNKYASSAL